MHEANCSPHLPGASYGILYILYGTTDESDGPGVLNKLLFAAYVLNIPGTFDIISEKILLVHTEPFIELPRRTNQDLIPKGLLLGMFEKFDKGTVSAPN